MRARGDLPEFETSKPVFRRFSPIDFEANDEKPLGTSALIAWGLSAFLFLAIGSFSIFSASSEVVGEEDNTATAVTVKQDPIITGSIRKPSGSVPSANDVLPKSPPATSPPKMEYGAEVARSNAVRKLVQVYSRFRATDPELFDKLKALINFDDSSDTLQARLVVGPFSDPDGVKGFCRSLQLPKNKMCAVAPFTGDRLPQEIK